MHMSAQRAQVLAADFRAVLKIFILWFSFHFEWETKPTARAIALDNINNFVYVLFSKRSINKFCNNSAILTDDALEQVFAISQHFGVSIDELTGNKVAEKAALSPRSVLAFLVDLLRTDKARVASWVNKEEVFIVGYGAQGPSCDHTYLDVEYPAIYFPSHFGFDGVDYDTQEFQELYAEFSQCGNETPFYDNYDVL